MRRKPYICIAVGNVAPRNVERAVVRATLLTLILLTLCLTLATPARANGTVQAVPFSQNWTDAGQITSSNNWNNVLASKVYEAARYRAILKPKAALSPRSVYGAVAVGGAGGVKDLAGNPLAANRTW